MFGMLTSDQLFALHSSLYDHATRVHRRMVGPDGHALISVFSDEWAILAACHAELTETQFAVCDELHRCDRERLTRDA